MEEQKKTIDIVMFGMSMYNEWIFRGVNNRNWHILQQLLIDERIGKILYVDYIPLTKKRSLRAYVESFLPRILHEEILEKSLRNRLSCVQANKLYVYSTTYTYKNIHKILFFIKKILTRFGFGNIISWSFHPFVTEQYMSSVGQKINVFDAVDNWAEHPSYLSYKKQLLEKYNFIDQRSDLIFTVAKEQESMFPKQHNLHWVPNGVDYEHFQKEFKLIHRDIGDIKKPIIGYIGTIQERFDVELFYNIATLRPQYSFVLVGPTSRSWKNEIFGMVSKDDIDLSRLQKLPNVHFLGRKLYKYSPMYLQQFSVGIIPHKMDTFVNSNNPMKMYEYLACGLPVVATPTSGTDMFSDYIFKASTAEEFVEKIDKALLEDSVELHKKRKEIIEQHSWKNRTSYMISEIFKIIE